jgi:hypothetical protein
LSNPLTLTIVEQSTYTGTWNYSDYLVTAVSTWTVTGNVFSETVTPDQAMYPYYRIKVNTPFEFTISVAFSLKYTSKRWDYSDSTYIIITYKEPVLEEGVSPFSIDGEFPHTTSNTVLTFSGTGTFTGSRQHINTRIGYYIVYDYRLYDKKGAIITELLDQRDGMAYAEVNGLSITSQ